MEEKKRKNAMIETTLTNGTKTTKLADGLVNSSNDVTLHKNHETMDSRKLMA